MGSSRNGPTTRLGARTLESRLEMPVVASLRAELSKMVRRPAVLAVYVLLLLATAVVCSSVAALIDAAPLRWPAAATTAEAFASALLILFMWASMGAVLAIALRGAAPALGLGIVYAVSELLLY